LARSRLIRIEQHGEEKEGLRKEVVDRRSIGKNKEPVKEHDHGKLKK
jgi:hypothetical protein